MTRAYEIIEHNYDVVVLGTGGARLGLYLHLNTHSSPAQRARSSSHSRMSPC
jgi:hypothetical protein